MLEPPPFGQPQSLGQHPWNDPFAPPDVLNPRPDAAFGVAGAFAPGPEGFPFTDEGKREYYAAVQRTADQLTMQQHLHAQADQLTMHQHLHAQAWQVASTSEQAAEQRSLDAVLLLLL
jgi:hypothetical protein